MSLFLVAFILFFLTEYPCSAFIGPKLGTWTLERELLMKNAISDGELSDIFRPENKVTIIGFGSLLSETSSRGTFPNLINFREVRVCSYARKFQHPAFIFFNRGIADLEAKTYSSLSTEPCPGAGFVAVAFEIEGESKEAWLKREEEFEFHFADYIEKDGSTSQGVMCCAPAVRDDSIFIERWGQEKYQRSLEDSGLTAIWNREAREAKSKDPRA